MERINRIIQSLASALSFLENEIQCVEDDYLAEEYQEIIKELEMALQLALEMANP